MNKFMLICGRTLKNIYHDLDFYIYISPNQAYKPQKKKKDPNAPKQPLSAYFLFSQEERLKVKNEHPSYSICEVAKELGKRWADMAPEVKQRYQQMAEEGRQKYDQDMAAYRQGNYTPEGGATNTPSPAGAPATVATTTTASVSVNSKIQIFFLKKI